jgi:hypothetical protein
MLRNIPNIFVLSVYIAIGTLGNIAVLIVYIHDMKNVLTSGRLFIPFMAFADLVNLIYNGGVEFHTEIQPFQKSADNETFCKMTRFIGLVLVITTACLYFAIAVHRYILICRPHSKGITRKWKIIIISGTCISVFGSSFPKYIFYGYAGVTMMSERIPNQTVLVYVCGPDEEFENKTSSSTYFIFLTISSFVWTCVYAALYALVGNRVRQRKKDFVPKPHLWKENRRLNMDSSELVHNDKPKPTPQTTVGSITSFVTNNRLTWMFSLITALNLISYMPKLLLDILYNGDRQFFLRKEKNLYVVLMFFDNFYLFNNVVNPFIYGCFDTEFRNKLKRRFCTCSRVRLIERLIVIQDVLLFRRR